MFHVDYCLNNNDFILKTTIRHAQICENPHFIAFIKIKMRQSVAALKCRIRPISTRRNDRV